MKEHTITVKKRLPVKVLILLLTVFTFTPMMAQVVKGPVSLDYRKTTWIFNTSEPAASSLSNLSPKGNFSAPTGSLKTFTVQFTASLKNPSGETRLLEIPDVLSITLRQNDPDDRNRQNYPAYPLPDGKVPVLEAAIMLNSAGHPDWKKMITGIPLAILKEPFKEHEFTISFTGVRFTFYVDGELLDNEFPFGYPEWATDNSWKIDNQYVGKASIFFPAIIPEKKELAMTVPQDIQYWTPEGHNCWVGDVVTIFYKGRYHLFYLYDRRHHQSKFGKGAHYFEHLSTADFKKWTIHDAATPLEEQWECIGTGTPFVLHDKLYLTYGLHTGRVYPEEMTTWPLQWKYLDTHGYTGAFNRDTTPGFPAGSSFAVSDDGISAFKKSGITFHPCQNPSVYTDPRGKLMMLANAGSEGTWTSDSIEGGWRCVNRDFPPGGDCTFFFHWGNFDYIVGGFTGFWSRCAGNPDLPYEDMVTRGLDFYDGSNVPAITEISGGRFIMAAWIPIRGWGGPLVIRELIQSPDGRLGSKWMREVTPETNQPSDIAAKITGKKEVTTGSRSFMLSFTVNPGNKKPGKAAILFLPSKGDKDACELQISPDEKRAQFGKGSLTSPSPREKSLREGGSPSSAADYAIENIAGVDRPFTVRILIKDSDKLGGSLIDTEIAGQRTMISYRPDLTVRNMVFKAEGAEITNVTIAEVK